MDAEIEDILKKAKTIAIVGLSDKPERESYGVALYLKNAGYKIIPVTPNIAEWHGIKAYASVLDIKEKIDVVDVFRRNEFVEELVDEVLKMKQKPFAIWMQLGVVNEEAAEKARNAGITVVMDRCMRTEHRLMVQRASES